MKFEELLKALGLDSEENKDKADILKKEFNATSREINNLTKSKTTLEAENEALKKNSEKFDIVVKSYGLDVDAEDFDKMLDDRKDAMIKEAGGGSAPEELKTLNRELNKIKRDYETATNTINELNEQLTAEKTQRINNVKRDAIHKALEANKIIKPDQMVDMFFNKVIVDEDGNTLTMKDDGGNELSVNDAIADWAKDNPEFVIKDTRGGVGSTGGALNNSSKEGLSEFMRGVLETRHGTASEGNQMTLEQAFG